MPMYLGNRRFRVMLNGGKYKFEHMPKERIYYVSLGDSIAVGHSINSDWESDYGYQTQYGEGDNTSTTIVPNSYTDLIKKNLSAIYGDEKVVATSYAHSGDTNVDLRDKLEHKAVQDSIKKASIVTICIGANTILAPATKEIPNFIANGNPTLLQLDNTLEAGFNMLSSGNETYGSYKNIIERLKELNTSPNTKFIFTSVYNPYKFLWVDESTDGNDYTDGFFGPIMWAAPNVEVDIPLVGQMDIRKFVYESVYLKDVTERINDPAGDGSYSLAEWVERKIERLNGILKESVLSCGDSRFEVADTKPLYDSYPDRHICEDYNYSDLVNVEIVKGQTIDDLDWGKFWDNWSIDSISSIVEDIATTVIEEVILPDTDPHPEEDGQYALYRSFANVLCWESLSKYIVAYYANGDSGSMAEQEVISIGYDRYARNLVAYTTARANSFVPETGHYFTGWNTKADGTGTGYSVGQVIGLTSDLTLYARWSNVYNLKYMHTNHTNLYGDDETGHKECYALYINGVEQSDFGKFSEGTERIITVPYGSVIRVVVSNYNPSELTYDDVDCDIYLNGSNVASGYRGTEYTFTLTTHTTVDFRWKISGSLVTFDMKSWEDCYITTY